MTKKTIWGRNFTLEVVYDCYSGEQVLETQRDAINQFVLEEKQMTYSEEKVKKYCQEINPEEIDEEMKLNIFKYVIPEKLFVKRDGRIAIMCKYKFDIEHGLAVVFKNGKLLEIGPQDIIL